MSHPHLLSMIHRAVERAKRKHADPPRFMQYKVSSAVAKKICAEADVQCPRLGYEVAVADDTMGEINKYKGYWVLVNEAGKFHLRFRYTE